jgi:hypothetical protein
MTSDSATLTATSAASSGDTDISTLTNAGDGDAIDVAGSSDNRKKEAHATVLRLLGSHVVCTLRDGRKARGTLVCVDRL